MYGESYESETFISISGIISVKKKERGGVCIEIRFEVYQKFQLYQDENIYNVKKELLLFHLYGFFFLYIRLIYKNRWRCICIFFQ